MKRRTSTATAQLPQTGALGKIETFVTQFHADVAEKQTLEEFVGAIVAFEGRLRNVERDIDKLPTPAERSQAQDKLWEKGTPQLNQRLREYVSQRMGDSTPFEPELLKAILTASYMLEFIASGYFRSLRYSTDRYSTKRDRTPAALLVEERSAEVIAVATALPSGLQFYLASLLLDRGKAAPFLVATLQKLEFVPRELALLQLPQDYPEADAVVAAIARLVHGYRFENSNPFSIGTLLMGRHGLKIRPGTFQRYKESLWLYVERIYHNRREADERLANLEVEIYLFWLMTQPNFPTLLGSRIIFLTDLELASQCLNSFNPSPGFGVPYPTEADKVEFATALLHSLLEYGPAAPPHLVNALLETANASLVSGISSLLMPENMDSAASRLAVAKWLLSREKAGVPINSVMPMVLADNGQPDATVRELFCSLGLEGRDKLVEIASTEGPLQERAQRLLAMAT